MTADRLSLLVDQFNRYRSASLPIMLLSASSTGTFPDLHTHLLTAREIISSSSDSGGGAEIFVYGEFSKGALRPSLSLLIFVSLRLPRHVLNRPVSHPHCR
jgi:hypothetical protein